jgi:hypothetical protein
MAADAGNRLAWEAKLKEAVMLQKMEYTMVVQVHKAHTHAHVNMIFQFEFISNQVLQETRRHKLIGPIQSFRLKLADPHLLRAFRRIWHEIVGFLIKNILLHVHFEYGKERY